MKIALVEGASTAYGFGSGEHGGWAAALHRDSIRYNEVHGMDPFIVSNQAVPGMTIIGANRNFGENRPNFVRNSSNQLIRIASFGQNEARVAPGERAPIVSLRKFAAELVMFCQSTTENGGVTLLLGPQHVDESLTTPCSDTQWSITNELIDEYDAAIRESADTFSAHYVSTAVLLDEYSPSKVLAHDGRHPNAFGHGLIHDEVARVLSTSGFIDLA